MMLYIHFISFWWSFNGGNNFRGILMHFRGENLSYQRALHMDSKWKVFKQDYHMHSVWNVFEIVHATKEEKNQRKKLMAFKHL